MYDPRHTARQGALLPVAFLILLLFAWACGAPEEISEPTQAPEPAQEETSEPPPRSDTMTALSQFLVCSGNPYALCYYSGPENAPTGTTEPVPALPCTWGEGGLSAKCKCYAMDDGSTNYVALPSILNPEVRQQTEETCGEDGRRCLNMANEKPCAETSDLLEHCTTIAPVCSYLGDLATGAGQTFYPEGSLISTFSFAHANDYPISSTDCSTEPYLRYAGCMTAGCGESYSEDGESFTDCECPTFVGPFQYGQSSSDLTDSPDSKRRYCDLGESNVWSAADMTVSLSLPDSSGD